MSRSIVERASRVLGRRTRRRGFLTKSAVVGSALAVVPTSYVLRPRAAYAAICNCSGSSCNCSDLCCDGYTEFCCTTYGTNGCPPGSLYGGWWKVSASNYCGGDNRYYMDCHGTCGGCGCGASGVCSGSCNGTACGCAGGSCGNRKVGCTHFRYGQCNTDVSCVGPIICRVVTCTAPWELEPNCTRSVRTDEATRYHNRACLQSTGQAPIGAVDIVEADNNSIRVRGWAIDPDVLSSIDINIHINGSLAATVDADAYRPDVGSAYRTYGANHGFDADVNTTTGTKEVCVYAINAGGGDNTLLGCQTVTVGSGTNGAIEVVAPADGVITVSGWAVANASANPADVELRVDAMLVATVPADRPRGDIANTFGTGGDNHGFEAVVEAAAGTHTICVTVPATIAGADDVDLGCRTVTINAASLVGAVDAIQPAGGSVRVAGWVHDLSGSEASVSITIDGQPVASAAAGRVRSDVAMDYPEAPNTGYDTIIKIAAGSYEICVYAVASNGTTGPLLGCANVTVAAS